jgi:hypothetical protein
LSFYGKKVVSSNRRILIVSPNFPPINAADHHRIRMSLPYLTDFGWDASILSVHPDFIQGVRDPFLSKTVPDDIPLIYSEALSINLARKIGLGNLGLRSFFYLLQTGHKLLQKQKFDLVYFSTTMFVTMALAPIWHKRFGLPYVLDFQDPWMSDYYYQPGSPSPPGGQIKYAFSQLQAKILEPKTLACVSHIISVSPTYPKNLQQRYPHLQPDQFTVLPFGAPEEDFRQLSSLQLKQNVFDRHDGKKHWVYVGRGGNDMALSLRILFSAIQQDRVQNPLAWQSIQLHFVGTSYAPGDKSVKTIEPIAQEYDIIDLVQEYSQRIPYFEALQIMVDSDAILLIGSDDPGYTASKLYPCILARKPILAVFHEESSVIDILTSCRAGRAVTFNRGDQLCDLTPKALAGLQWLQSLPADYQPDTNWQAFQPYTAKEMTRKQCEIFDRVVGTVSQN